MKPTSEHQAVISDALEQLGCTPDQIRRALVAISLDVDAVCTAMQALNSHPGDEEQAHIKADYMLLECISSPAITKAFKSVWKWYA